MKDIVLVLDNLRSAHNVGSIMRTAAALSVKQIYALGRTPYPLVDGDQRLPHVAERAQRQIAKTALGSESVVTMTPIKDVLMLIQDLKAEGYRLIAIENEPGAGSLPEFKLTSDKAALIVGHEIDGISPELIKASDDVLAIPMSEYKKSLNVASAAAMALYHFRFKA